MVVMMIMVMMIMMVARPTIKSSVKRITKTPTPLASADLVYLLVAVASSGCKYRPCAMALVHVAACMTCSDTNSGKPTALMASVKPDDLVVPRHQGIARPFRRTIMGVTQATFRFAFDQLRAGRIDGGQHSARIDL